MIYKMCQLLKVSFFTSWSQNVHFVRSEPRFFKPYSFQKTNLQIAFKLKDVKLTVADICAIVMKFKQGQLPEYAFKAWF